MKIKNWKKFCRKNISKPKLRHLIDKGLNRMLQNPSKSSWNLDNTNVKIWFKINIKIKISITL